MNSIGQSINRIDAVGKVLGKSKFPADYNYPDQLYLKIKFSDKPHAIIKSVDISKAEKVDGVIAVLTAKDVPNNEYGLIKNDQPVLCGPGSSKLYADRVKFIGDQIAVVIAETEQQAEEAVKQIIVQYEELPVITDPEESLKDSAFLLHPDHGSNIYIKYRIIKGDTEKAFSDSDVIIESDYYTPAQEHAYLQPEAGVAYLDEESRITIVCSGQWTHGDQKQIAHALNLEQDRVRIIYPAIGGAFGGREDLTIQLVLGLAVKRLNEKGINRPVKIIWSREESIIGHHKRHPYILRMKWGAKNDGTLLAAEVNVIADAGAYAYTSSKVLGNATLLSTGPYKIPNVKVNTCAVYTNNLPNGAFRGFGGPQAAFAAEMQINKIAEALDIDPVQIRMLNLLDEGDPTSVGSPLPEGVSLKKVVKDCALASGWVNKSGKWLRETDETDKSVDPHIKYGIGIACGLKNVGFSFGFQDHCQAKIELHGHDSIEEAILYHSGAEVGQGAHTVFTQMAADALNISADRVKLVLSDTGFTDDAGSASASRMTFMAGNSIKGAAELAIQNWEKEERPAIGYYDYLSPKTTPYHPETGECNPNFSYGYVAEAVVIKLDIQTGQLEVQNITCSDDVGKAINPIQVEGQIEGALIQALGYGLMENFIQKDGKVLTKKLSTYLIPTALDIPDRIDTRILEIPDPVGPWGARGVGEMPFIPLAPALNSAVHNATGVWINHFPLTAEVVFSALNRD